MSGVTGFGYSAGYFNYMSSKGAGSASGACIDPSNASNVSNTSYASDAYVNASGASGDRIAELQPIFQKYQELQEVLCHAQERWQTISDVIRRYEENGKAVPNHLQSQNEFAHKAQMEADAALVKYQQIHLQELLEYESLTGQEV